MLNYFSFNKKICVSSKKAAPLVAAGIGAITGASIVVTAASSVVLMTSLFGIAGGGLAGNTLYYIMKINYVYNNKCSFIFKFV
jgi:hypothetical protein